MSCTVEVRESIFGLEWSWPERTFSSVGAGPFPNPARSGSDCGGGVPVSGLSGNGKTVKPWSASPEDWPYERSSGKQTAGRLYRNFLLSPQARHMRKRDVIIVCKSMKRCNEWHEIAILSFFFLLDRKEWGFMHSFSRFLLGASCKLGPILNAKNRWLAKQSRFLLLRNLGGST